MDGCSGLADKDFEGGIKEALSSYKQYKFFRRV